MNLLAIIIVFLAIVTAGAIAYIAWELSSGEPVFGRSVPQKTDEPPAAAVRPGEERPGEERPGEERSGARRSGDDLGGS